MVSIQKKTLTIYGSRQEKRDKCESTFTMYSDDTAICYSSDNMEVITIINSELINLNEWLQGNTLSLNIVKTQAMIIGYKGTKLRLRSHYSVSILIRFWSKNRGFFFSVHITPYQTETDIYQLMFTLFLKNASVFLFLKTRPSRLLILAFSNCSVLVFTLQSCVHSCQTWEFIPRSWEFFRSMGFLLGIIFSKKPWDKSWEL